MHNNWLENVGGQFAVFDQVQEATVPKKRQCHEKSITVDSASYSFMPETMLNEFASTCYDLKGELMENPIFSRVFSECAHCFSGHCPFNLLQMEDPIVLRQALDVTRRQLWDLQNRMSGKSNEYNHTRQYFGHNQLIRVFQSSEMTEWTSG